MAILIDKKTKVLVQGITGKEGTKSAIAMRDYGTSVVAGVTPGKGGLQVEGVPVFDTVKEAKDSFPEINCSVLYVPAMAIYDAALEAIETGIKLINIVTEHVPTHDIIKLIAYARTKEVQIIGPGSIGIITPAEGKIGSIGGFTPQRSFRPGNIGIISKSGGMCSELSSMLSLLNLGQSTVIGIGGDRIIGTTFADLMLLFEQDKKTKLVVLYGEIGGTYEEQAATLLLKQQFTKPLVACVSGIFASTLPEGLSLGHAGAIIQGGEGTRDSKITALKKAGAFIAETSDQIPDICRKIINP